MKLTKEQLRRMIKEELGSIKEYNGPEKLPDTTGFFTGPGFDDEEDQDDEESRWIDRMREKAIEKINEMNADQLKWLVGIINPET